MEETVVRDKAVESLRSVAEQLSGKQIEEYFIPMIKRLALGTSTPFLSVIPLYLKSFLIMDGLYSTVHVLLYRF